MKVTVTRYSCPKCGIELDPSTIICPKCSTPFNIVQAGKAAKRQAADCFKMAFVTAIVALYNALKYFGPKTPGQTENMVGLVIFGFCTFAILQQGVIYRKRLRYLRDVHRTASKPSK
jgi:hypothetical protein